MQTSPVAALILAAALLSAAPLPAGSAETPGDAEEIALTPEQEREAKAIDHLLISPCCWTTSVADHGSGMAPVLKQEVREMVARGMTRQAIIDHYVAEYGERILVEPKRSGFNLLAYWMPWIAVVIGLGLIVAWSRRRKAPGPARASAEPAEETNPYRRRIQEEMKHLDG